MLLAVANMLCIWFCGGCLLLANWMAIRKKSEYLLYMAISAEQREDADVVQLVKEYKTALWKFIAVLFVSSFGFFLCGEYVSIQLWYMCAWFVVAIMGDYKLVKKYAGKMYDLKKEKGWCLPSRQVSCNVDTAVSRMKKTLPVSEFWMFIPVWICIASFLWWFLRGTEYTILLLFPVMDIVVLVLAFYIFHHASHGKLKVYSEDSDVNYALNRAAKRAWTGAVVWESVLLCAYQFFLMLWMYSYMKDIAEDGVVSGRWGLWGVFIGLNLLEIVSFVCVFFGALSRVKRARKELAVGWEEFLPEDADIYWKNGYYYNPYDTNTFVENRSSGFTTNMATAWGKITKWVLLGSLIFCIGSGIAMLPLDFGTITARKNDSGIELKGCLYYKETIAFDEIKTVTLLDQSPGLSRIFGSGMKKVALGSYHFKGYGSGRSMVYREAEYFVLVEKTNGKLVMFSLEDAKELLECYNILKKHERTEE
ncbi:MAG: hypothetical protein J1E35_01925 [Lachnospiraceae bacterium]|nr:hypothetical protein [Lachnospiraceae bacterium]